MYNQFIDDLPHNLELCDIPLNGQAKCKETVMITLPCFLLHSKQSLPGVFWFKNRIHEQLVLILFPHLHPKINFPARLFSDPFSSANRKVSQQQDSLLGLPMPLTYHPSNVFGICWISQFPATIPAPRLVKSWSVLLWKSGTFPNITFKFISTPCIRYAQHEWMQVAGTPHIGM